MTDLKHPILTDKPADRDGLDFQPYVEALADLIKAPGTSTPLTIGLCMLGRLTGPGGGSLRG